MPVKTTKELFVMLLSDLRQGTQKAANIYQEIGQLAQDPEVKEALEARAFISDKVLATLDRCFNIIGETPVALSGHLEEVFAEDLRKELAEIKTQEARRLFALAKLNYLAHLRIGQYEALIVAATLAGHHGVSLLLQTCLADKLVYVKRTRNLIRNVVETKVAERKAASA